ncbi:MAG: hypothetical protein EXR77_12795 [Myxococcales bacterium]|nr:hypothetical protein [Myxococcales bacterium]
MILKLAPIIVVLSVSLASASCVSTGGGGSGSGGGGSGVASAAGIPCNPKDYTEGCFGKARMHCDPATSKWAELNGCSADQICTETQVLGAAATQKTTQCTAAPANGPADSANGETAPMDGATAGDAGVGQDGSVNPPLDTAVVEVIVADTAKDVLVIADTTTDSGPEVSPTQFSDCLSKKCPEAWLSCGANTKCIAFLTCGEGCTTSACVASCAQKNFSEETVLLSECAATSGCVSGTTSQVCGNGKCEGSETASSCPQDCGTKPVCGNGLCESGETPSNCAKDCANVDCCVANSYSCGFAAKCGKSCGTCPSTQTCTANVCKGGSTGDCLQLKCGTELSSCQNDQVCVGIWAYAAIGGCSEANNCQDNACLESNCGEELAQCQSKTACTQLITCLSNCKTDQACANKCAPAAGLAKYQTLGECYKAKCPQ